MGGSAMLTVDLDQTHLPHAVVVRVAGELDYATTPRLLDAVAKQPPAGASVILDAHALTFCDSSALGAMIAMRRAAVDAGGGFFVTGVQRQVMSALRVTSLDQLLQVRDDVAVALAEIGCPDEQGR